MIPRISVLSFFILLKPTFEIIESVFNCCSEFPTTLLWYHHHKVFAVLWLCSCAPLGIVFQSAMEWKGKTITFCLHSIFLGRISLVEIVLLHGWKYGNFCWRKEIYSEKTINRSGCFWGFLFLRLWDLCGCRIDLE